MLLLLGFVTVAVPGALWIFVLTESAACFFSRRVQYVIEGLFETRRKKFSDHPMVRLGGVSLGGRGDREKKTSIYFHFFFGPAGLVGWGDLFR